ncbi:MAG: Xaa-Pro peptidase family protein [Planctomycetota bacterium]|nr:Xaa-Pro peptidase family protein [Planctomycetota bacterium]
MADPTIPFKEYAARRQKVITALKKSVGVVFAGEQDAHLPEAWRPHPHFEYLTGVIDEPGAVLMLDPSNPVEARRDILFLRPLDPEVEKWDGLRMEISKALRDRCGFKTIFRTGHLPRFLTEAAKRSRSLACLHPLAQYNQPVTPDLEIFGKIAQRIPGTQVVDCSEEIAKLRSVKSSAEQAMIRKAIDITRLGFETVMKTTRPGMNEFEVQENLEHAYRANGSRTTGFHTIIGSGVNSTVLHYSANDRVIEDGDLMCIDSGAVFGPGQAGYGADITRTIPANGRFTKRQREIYDLVLKAEEAAIRAVKPGVTLAQLDKVARAIITKAGYGDYFIHSIGHHLGLETHDATPEGGLKVGAVVTIEPGIYIPDEAIGVRIEDDVLVTKDGRRNLSSRIPKTAAAVEKMMAGK